MGKRQALRFCGSLGSLWLILGTMLLLTALSQEKASHGLRVPSPRRHLRTWSDLLQRGLDLEQSGLEPVKERLALGDETGAWTQLLRYYRARRVPADPQVQHWLELRDQQFAEFWTQDAAETPKRWGKDGRINWRNQNQPPRNQYESFEIRNRLINLAGWTAAAQVTKSASLRQQVIDTFLDWYRDCPAPELPVTGWWDGHKTGFAWQEIEVALRGRMLISIFFASLDWPEASAEFHQSLLVAIHQCMDFLTNLWSRFGFKPHNHQNLHGMTLLAGGVLLPEMKAAPTWKQLGLHILKTHAQSDFGPDGVQVENSPHYHAKVFFAYLDAYEVLRAVPQQHQAELAWLEKHLNQTADFLLHSCDASGRHLPINDGWYTSNRALLRRAARTLDRPDLLVLEGQTPASHKVPPTARVFPHAGLAFMRSSWQSDAVVVALDASGQRSGHWHCGKPQFIIHAGGYPLACDPQMANYDDPSQWLYFKRAEAHNVVLVDGQGDAEPSGPWTYKRVSRPRWMGFCTNSLVDMARATTDGFQKLNDPVLWERTLVFVKPSTILVHDVLRSQGRHRYDWLVHLTPQEPLLDRERKSLCTRIAGPFQLVVSPAPGTEQPLQLELRQGKYHPRTYPPQFGYWFPLQYGDLPAEVVDAPYAVWSCQAEGTVTLDFVLSVVRPNETPASVRKLAVAGESLVTAYEVTLPDNKVVTVIFDDREPAERPPVQVGPLVLRGRIGAGTPQNWLTLP